MCRLEAEKRKNERLKTELGMTLVHRQVASETGVPIELITGATVEECRAQADSIKSNADSLTRFASTDALKNQVAKRELFG
ncbi:hypothetical protein G1C94_0985 [Bifidobacterium sp. DSM 109963]|uniref:Uncharacterized protein n=2 Tax=Bifidobacterium panos TaxID=2675321 RepID=A0ABX1T145_9BIFI|nr:hypothetical protein [Bifidobacterium sp. DSM 109963]